MKKKRFLILSISIIAIICLTVCTFFLVQNYKYVNRDRVIILAYQTNISGSDAEHWQNKLSEKFGFDIEVSPYTTKSAGNDDITITTENGWQQIVTRLAAKQGDILFLNKETYENMLNADFLAPIGYLGKNAVMDNGTTYGIDISGLSDLDLIALDTNAAVGQFQPYPICSLDDSVIAVIYKGSKHIGKSADILVTLFGEKNEQI